MSRTSIVKGMLALCLAVSAQTSIAGVCEAAESGMAKIVGTSGAVTAGAGAGLASAGVMGLTHSSGAMIVSTASGGYVAGTLGFFGTLVSIATAPATIVVGGVVAAGVGGTALYCYLSD